MPTTTNNIVRFRKEDYKESPSWFDRVIYTLNILVDYTSSLGSSITNLSTSVSSLPIVTSFSFNQLSSATSTTNPETNTKTFVNPFNDETPAQLLIYATNSSIPIFTSPVWASWHAADGVIFIDSITGLANSTTYTFTVTLIGQ